jgi:hypothetical protein
MKARRVSHSLFALGVAVVVSSVLLAGGAASASTPAGMSPAVATPTYTTFGSQGQGVSAPITLAGTFSNAPSGSSAQLFSKAFPFSGSKMAGATEKLTVSSKGTAPFSFTVRPEIATKYWVELLNPDGSVDSTFKLQTVYVVSTRALVPVSQSCTNKTCQVRFSLFRYLPSAVSTYELAKPYYDYLGITWSTTSTPPPPSTMNLVHGWTVSATTPVRNATDEFETTFGFSFTLQEPWFSFASTACTIDSVTKDGFGLPGSHGCGSAQVPVSSSYLG